MSGPEKRLCLGGPLDGQLRTILHGTSFSVVEEVGRDAGSARFATHVYRKERFNLVGEIVEVWAHMSLKPDAVQAAFDRLYPVARRQIALGLVEGFAFGCASDFRDRFLHNPDATDEQVIEHARRSAATMGALVKDALAAGCTWPEVEAAVKAGSQMGQRRPC